MKTFTAFVVVFGAAWLAFVLIGLGLGWLTLNPVLAFLIPANTILIGLDAYLLVTGFFND